MPGVSVIRSSGHDSENVSNKQQKTKTETKKLTRDVKCVEVVKVDQVNILQQTKQKTIFGSGTQYIIIYSQMR